MLKLPCSMIVFSSVFTVDNDVIDPARLPSKIDSVMSPVFFDTPTRGNNILDLVLCSDVLSCDTMRLLPLMGTSDHAVVI